MGEDSQVRIALAGPVRFDEVAPLLHEPVPEEVRAIGGGSPVSTLARGLHDRGHDVVVVTLSYGASAVSRHTGDRFEVLIGPYRAHHRARDGFSAEREVVRAALNRSEPDVAHAHWTYEFASGALASSVATLVTVHDWAPTILRHHPHPYRLVRLAMAARVLRQARALTAPSPYIRKRVRRWSPGDVSLVPNAIADEDFATEGAVERREIDQETPTLLALNVGWGHRKNVAVLLHAFTRIRQQVPGATLRLVGPGYGPGEAAQQFAREKRLECGVEFVGELPYREAMRALGSADLFVHPAREESFGLVILEAMAQGVPVVAGRGSGAVPWVCAEGRAGVLTDVTSPRALARAVSDLVRDADRQAALRRDAHRWARDRFSLSTVLDRYEQLYARLREGAR